jgi:hypothetical protein
MNLAVRGGLAGFALLALGGCLAPMSQREAQGYGALSMRNYCAETLPCRSYRLVKAQHLGDGWMLDYESDRAKYGVMVHKNGVSEVSVWNKS